MSTTTSNGTVMGAAQNRRGKWRLAGDRARDPRIVERFLRFVEKSDGCWIWIGGRNRDGYGVFSVDEQVQFLAHRFAYEAFVGPIGELLVLHRCDNPPCVRRDHLYAGTPADNTRDMIERGSHYVPALLSHCHRGHPLAGDNLQLLHDGRRNCRTCRRDRERARRAAARRAS